MTAPLARPRTDSRLSGKHVVTQGRDLRQAVCNSHLLQLMGASPLGMQSTPPNLLTMGAPSCMFLALAPLTRTFTVTPLTDV